MSKDQEFDPSVDVFAEIDDASTDANEAGAGVSGGWVCTISAEVTGYDCNPF